MALEDYTIVDRIGAGTFGITHKAKYTPKSNALLDITPDTLVCIKELKFGIETESKDAIEVQQLFRREARTLHGLNHPNIPRYIDFFTETKNGKDQLYLVMEYIPGITLEEVIAKRPLSEKDVLEKIIDLAHTLDYLHAFPVPIIHRDLKPKNIIETPVPDRRNKIVDLGSVTDTVLQETRLEGHTVLGTVGFTAPEILAGKKPTSASDIYSLGAIALYLLSGGVSPVSMTNDDNRLDWKGKLNMSTQVDSLLLAMTEQNPTRRIKTAKELLARVYEFSGKLSSSSSEEKKEIQKEQDHLFLKKGESQEDSSAIQNVSDVMYVHIEKRWFKRNWNLSLLQKKVTKVTGELSKILKIFQDDFQGFYEGIQIPPENFVIEFTDEKMGTCHSFESANQLIRSLRNQEKTIQRLVYEQKSRSGNVFFRGVYETVSESFMDVDGYFENSYKAFKTTVTLKNSSAKNAPLYLVIERELNKATI